MLLFFYQTLNFQSNLSRSTRRGSSSFWQEIGAWVSTLKFSCMLFIISTTLPSVWFTNIYVIFQQLLLDVWYFNWMQSFSSPWFGPMLYNLTNNNLLYMPIHWHGCLHQLPLSIISHGGRICFTVNCTIPEPHAVKRPNVSVTIEEKFPSSILKVRQQFSALKNLLIRSKIPSLQLILLNFSY